MESIVEFLAHRFTQWQIAVLGVIAVLAGMVAATFVGHLCYIAFPDAWGWIAAGHVLAVGLIGWFGSGVFVDAYIYRGWVEAIVANLQLANQLGHLEEDGLTTETEDAK